MEPSADALALPQSDERSPEDSGVEPNPSAALVALSAIASDAGLQLAEHVPSKLADGAYERGDRSTLVAVINTSHWTWKLKSFSADTGKFAVSPPTELAPREGDHVDGGVFSVHAHGYMTGTTGVKCTFVNEEGEELWWATNNPYVPPPSYKGTLDPMTHGGKARVVIQPASLHDGVYEVKVLIVDAADKRFSSGVLFGSIGLI